MIGHADGPPLFPQLAMGDVNTGVHALAAITAALLDREDTGEGQFVDISLLDTYFHMHEVNVQAYSGSQGQIRPRRSGPHHYAISPLGIWKGKAPGRWLLLIPLLPAQWEAMCKLMGRADILTDPRFATNADRVANEPELIEIIQNWIDAQESDEAIIRMFNEKRIPIAPILSVPEAMAHPHLIERETIRTVHDRAFGDLQIPGVPLRFSRFKNDLPLEAAFLGEHSREVLREFLGYSDEAIAALEADGVIKTSEQAA
jgi:CoA:oxalate CoA-transferase